MAQAEQQLIFESDSKNRKIIVMGFFTKSVLLLVMVLCLVAFFIIRQAIAQAPSAKIEVNEEGLSLQQYQQLNEAMQLTYGGSFFSADISIMHEKAKDFDWIDEINITRNWNKGIVVDVLPKQAVARFGSEKAIDAKGQVYEPANINNLAKSDLVMLQGNPEQSEAIMQQMQQINTWFEPLGLSVEDIILTPRMTWLIKFDSGLRLLVDGENTSEKLLTVSHVLQTQLANERNKIQSVDLRYKNGFAIDWKPEAADSVSNNSKKQKAERDKNS